MQTLRTTDVIFRGFFFCLGCILRHVKIRILRAVTRCFTVFFFGEKGRARKSAGAFRRIYGDAILRRTRCRVLSMEKQFGGCGSSGMCVGFFCFDERDAKKNGRAAVF